METRDQFSQGVHRLSHLNLGHTSGDVRPKEALELLSTLGPVRELHLGRLKGQVHRVALIDHLLADAHQLGRLVLAQATRPVVAEDDTERLL